MSLAPGSPGSHKSHAAQFHLLLDPHGSQQPSLSLTWPSGCDRAVPLQDGSHMTFVQRQHFSGRVTHSCRSQWVTE